MASLDTDPVTPIARNARRMPIAHGETLFPRPPQVNSLRNDPPPLHLRAAHGTGGPASVGASISTNRPSARSITVGA
jgi:hypothetical protein